MSLRKKYKQCKRCFQFIVRWEIWTVPFFCHPWLLWKILDIQNHCHCQKLVTLLYNFRNKGGGLCRFWRLFSAHVGIPGRSSLYSVQPILLRTNLSSNARQGAPEENPCVTQTGGEVPPTALLIGSLLSQSATKEKTYHEQDHCTGGVSIWYLTEIHLSLVPRLGF